MSQILSGLDGIQCYLDDERLKAVLHRSNRRGLKLKKEKCLFRQTKLFYSDQVDAIKKALPLWMLPPSDPFWASRDGIQS